MSTTARPGTELVAASPKPSGSARRTVVRFLAVVGAFAGVEHGVGELLQNGKGRGSLFIQSWPDVTAFEPLSGEPAMTLIPDLRVAGLVTIVVSLGLAWWGLRTEATRRDGWVLLGLSILLLLVGGGFGPPLVGLTLGVAMLTTSTARRREVPLGRGRAGLARSWRLLLVLTVSAFLALFPGVVLLQWWFGFDNWVLVSVLPIVAFAGLVVTLAAAHANDLGAAHERAAPSPRSNLL